MSSLPPPPLPDDLPVNFTGAPVTHKRAVAALVCGVSALVFFPIVLGVVAIVLGYQARQIVVARSDVYKGTNVAVAGMILGAVSVGLFLVVVSTEIG